MPYLTANVQFELERLPGVMLVPNAALRWMPAAEQIALQFRKDFIKEERGKSGKIWILDGKYVRPILVRVGLSNGAMTSVEGEGLAEGMTIVTGTQQKGMSGSDANNPFAPKFPGRNKGGSSR